MLRLHGLLLPAVGLAVAGCDFGAEPCFYDPASASITASPTEGTSPLTVALEASGSGSACGCCGGREPGEIEEFRWDLDGDSTTDAVGASASVTLREPGLHAIVVTVIDSAGQTAAAAEVITVADGS